MTNLEPIETPDVPEMPDEGDLADNDIDERLASLDDEVVDDDLDAKLAALEGAERAIDSAYSTGKAERAKITQMAQLDAAEAVAMVGVAMEADEAADEAARITVIAEQSGNREQAKAARKKEREARRAAKADHAAATKSAKRAYEAIKFSAPNTMGFMRVVQVLFACHIAVYLVWLMLTSRDAMTYTVTTMMDWVMVILEGVAFWMFINRYKIGRPFCIAMAAIGIVVPAFVDIAAGHFNFIALVTSGAFYIFLLFYFIFSKRVKATLVNDFAKHDGDFEKEDFVINRRGWPFYRNLIMYFILFSVIGHWMEMGMCQFIILGIVQGEYDPSNTLLWRDWLYPFPMEGAAVVIIALVLYPFFVWLKKKFPGKKRVLAYVISFFAGALLCTLIEFSMGLIVNADLQLWDYRDNFCNIMGQVCLQNTTAFGVVAAIITWWVYPLLERWIARVPRDIMNIVFVVVAVFGAIIWSLYIINPPGVDEQNKHPELAGVIAVQQEEEKIRDERTKIDSAFDLLGTMTSTEREDVANSGYLTDAEKANITAELDKIDASVKVIRGELAETDEEIWSSVIASSGASSASSSESSSASAEASESSVSAAAA